MVQDVSATNVTPADLFAVMFKEQVVEVPLQSPVQELTLYPLEGVAVRVTAVPEL